MDNHNYRLDLFEHFEAHQQKLDPESLLRLDPVVPHWTVNAYADDVHKWEDWAYDEDELESLIDLAKQQGLEPLIEKWN